MITTLPINNGPFYIKHQSCVCHVTSPRFVIFILLGVLAIFFHFTGTEMLQRLDFFPKQWRLQSDSTRPDFSEMGVDKSKKNCAALLPLSGSKGEVLPRCLRWRPSQILIMWTTTSTAVSESALPFKLHLAVELIFCTVAATHVCVHTHIYTQPEWNVQWASSAHTITPSHTRTSSYCLKYKQMPCRNTFFLIHRHEHTHVHVQTHTYNLSLYCICSCRLGLWV